MGIQNKYVIAFFQSPRNDGKGGGGHSGGGGGSGGGNGKTNTNTTPTTPGNNTTTPNGGFTAPVLIEPDKMATQAERDAALKVCAQEAMDGTYGPKYWSNLLAAFSWDGKYVYPGDLAALEQWLIDNDDYDAQKIAKFRQRYWEGSVALNPSVSPEVAAQGPVAVKVSDIAKMGPFLNPARPTGPAAGAPLATPNGPGGPNSGPGSVGEIDPKTGDYMYPMSALNAGLPAIGRDSQYYASLGFGSMGNQSPQQYGPYASGYRQPQQNNNPWVEVFSTIAGVISNPPLGYNSYPGAGQYGFGAPQGTGRPVLDTIASVARAFGNGGGGGFNNMPSYRTPPINPWG